jgi:hypothetical protein
MTNSKIDKLINDFEKNQDILFNQDRIFYDLFENNNYHPIVGTHPI